MHKIIVVFLFLISTLSAVENSAYFDIKQNKENIKVLVEELETLNNKANPNIKIIFKRINPTKYRVVLLNVEDKFNLIFSENFHKYWKAYLVKWNEQNSEKLDDGNFYETWFDTAFEIPDKYHWQVNKFANSWLIKPELLINKDDKFYKKNIDGSYNFEIILEFYPQRIYMGLQFLAILILFISLTIVVKNRFTKHD